MNPEQLCLLRQALPYINRFKGQTFVVKIGGEVAEDPEVLHTFCEEVALLALVGIRIVMVHGGGKQATDLSEKLGIESRMVDGRRVTDEKTLDVVMMVFAGKINTEILSSLRRAGVEAVGISGIDGGILNAVKRPPRKRINPETGREEVVDFGHVGDIASVDPKLLQTLLAGDFVPVIASLGGDDSGAILNINADTVAAKIAGALGARKLILASGVDGILAKDGTLLSRLTPPEIEAKVQEGVITGGMIPKTASAVSALGEGVMAVHIINGRKPSTLLGEVFTDTGAGTMIRRAESAEQRNGDAAH
jgi:acetylglutamate kinase